MGDVAGHVVVDKLVVGDVVEKPKPPLDNVVDHQHLDDVVDEQVLDDVVDEQLHIGNLVDVELEVGNVVHKQPLDNIVDKQLIDDVVDEQFLSHELVAPRS